MTADRRAEVEALYRAALERPVAERARFVAERTADDLELRAAVQALLAGNATAIRQEVEGIGAAQGHFPEGEQIGHYRVEHQLGAGGMGVVYRATDTRLNRSVAIKFLAEQFADAAARRRFQREAQMASSLNHPHILTVHDVGEHAGRQYIVTELVDGGTLIDWAAKQPSGGCRSWRQVVELLSGVADALATAHEAKILHRDVKPGNILINKNGYAKLADFGLATLTPDGGSSRRAAHAVTAANLIVGTLAYMSPEQTLGASLDARSDVFSFGVVLYEALAGRRPFTADSDPKLVDAIVHAPPPVLSGAIPQSLRRMVAKAIEKEPADRYQSMRELVVELRRILRAPDAAGGEVTDSGGRPAAKARGRKGIESLAVLPLVNTSGDPDSEYLSQGIAESLTNSLSQLPKLRIAQQQKAFRHKGADVDLQHAASELRVQAILAGKVMLRGDTLVVNMTLVDVERDAQVWGQQYTKKMADILQLQEEIADEVLDALRLKMTKAPRKRRPTQSTEAYHLYLKGRFFSAKRTSDNLRKAIELYQQALDKDPSYALAYAGIADCYVLLGFTPYAAMKPSEAFPRAKAAAQKALAFDDSLAEAHASLGACALLYEWDWAASERAFRQSLGVAPDNVGALVWHSTLLAVMGRHEEAIREARRALAVDPLSVIAAAHVSLRLYNAKRYDEAIVAAKTAIEMDRAYPSAHAYLAFAYEASDRLLDAIAAAETVASITLSPHWRGYLGSLYGFAGRRDEAKSVLAELEDLASRTYVSPFSIALVHAGLGDSASWRKWIQASLDERSGLLVYLRCAEWHMRSDSFYDELMRRVGVP